MKNLFFTLLTLCSINLYSQEMSAYISAGGGFASESVYPSRNFQNGEIELLTYAPNLSGKIGVAYGPIAKLYDLNMDLTLDIGYFSSTAKKTDEFLGKFKMNQSIVPVFLSTIISSEGKLSPFLKIGLGLGKKTSKSQSEKFSEGNVSVQKWFFMLNPGTGLTYTINPSLKCSAIIDVFVLKGTLYTRNEYGFSTGLTGLQLNSYFGLQLNYCF